MTHESIGTFAKLSNMVEMLKATDPRSPILRYGIALVAVVLALLLTGERLFFYSFPAVGGH